MSGSPSGSGLGVAERLDRAHEVVAEEAHRAAGERRRVGHRRLVEAGDALGRERVGIAAVGQRPAQHRARAEADERPAPDALALLGGLEQERRLAGRERAQLQERRDRRLAVLDEAVAQRDQVVRARPARAPARALGVHGSGRRARRSGGWALGATAIEHPLGVGERAAPAAQQHEQVVEHVGRLFVDALVGSSRAARATSSASSITFSPIRGGSSSSSTV